MGNCSQKGCISNSNVHPGQPLNKFRILTGNGRMIDMEGPKLAREVLNNHPPGLAIFRQNGLSLPLFGHEKLQNGQIYYLMPIRNGTDYTPERARYYNHSAAARGGVGGRFETGKNGVWRVKLAVTVEELEEMFTGQLDAEKLIHRMRMGQQRGHGNVLRPIK